MKTEDFDKIKKRDKVTWKSFWMDAPGGYKEYTGIAVEYFKGRTPEYSDGWLCEVEGYSVLIPMTRSMSIIYGIKIEKREKNV